jgi:hypothetical protein
MQAKLAALPVALLSLLCAFAAVLNAKANINPSQTNAQSSFSADDFDWRETVPYLFTASALPGEQGIKVMLENCSVLRAYVVDEIRAECRRARDRCAASTLLEGDVTKRIDEIVQESVFHRNKAAIVDYRFARQPFPFSEIAAVRSEKRQDAYLMLALADRSYTATQLEAKYGEPYDTNIFQWYSVFQYRASSVQYGSKAVFEVDPVNGAVMKVSVSLKRKKSHRSSPH